MTDLKVTSASDYARLGEKTEQGELVPMPSGAVFRMRRADFDSLMIMGATPQSLMNVGMKAWKEQGKLTEDMLDRVVDQVLEEVKENPEEMNKNLIFIREMVRSNVLEPRIGYNEFGAIALLDSQGQAIAKLQDNDFWFAFEWISGGEGYHDGLAKFRSRRERRATNASPRKQKPRHTAKPVLQN